MSIIKNILVPTDFSQTSQAALDVAISLSLAHYAGLSLLHVHEPTAFELPDGYAVPGSLVWSSVRWRRRCLSEPAAPS